MSCFRIASLFTAAGLIAAIAPASYGQKWEVGAGGGASIYSSKSISAPAGSVDAKFKPGYGFSAFVGQIGNRVGGELRYSWQSNEMELSGLSRNFTMGGRTQAIHYDLSIYLNGKNSGARPYLLVGGGMKQYTGTGAAVAIQPLGSIAVLTNTSEWKPLVTAGGGVRFATGKKSQIRAEVRLFLTEAPTKVITPVTGSLSGWYINFMPMVSLSYVW
jgi:hypothetical protein